MPKSKPTPPTEGGSYVTVKGKRDRVAFTGPAEDRRRRPAPAQATAETQPADEPPARARGRRASQRGDVTDG